MQTRPYRKTFVISIVVVSVLVIAGMLFTRTSAKAPDYMTAPAPIGSIRTVVSATGTIQPVVTVQVGSQTSGQVQELYADFNSVVKRGQLLAKIPLLGQEGNTPRLLIFAKEIRGQTYKSPNYVQRSLIRNWRIYTSVPEFLFVPFVFPSNLD